MRDISYLSVQSAIDLRKARPVRMREQVVAVVEDDPGMLRSIERLLKAYKYQTATFTSAEAFLEDTAASAATCLVLDIHLNGMSGIDLRRRLTASGSSLPVIFISAVDDESVHEEALATGCVAYLRKPFLAHLLIAAINKSVQ
jgi:FixJ family two-component response regulator